MSDSSNTSKVSFKPVENILNAYDQPSYSLALYMTDDKTGTNKVCILQTGKAPFSVQSLRIESSVGPTKDAKNTTVTKVNMVIKEPMGATFVDTMFTAFNALGNKNIQEIPYKLVIFFHGYNASSGSIVSNINNTTFTYFLKLNNINTNINNGDVTHNVDFIPFQETALYDCYNVFGNGFSITVPKNATFGNLISSIKDSLNDNYKKTYGNDGIQYDFKFMDYPTNTILPNIKNPKDLKIKLSDIKYTSSITADTMHFSDLSTIVNVIETILSSSEDALTLIAPNAASNKNVLVKNTTKYVKSIAHHISTQMTLGDYDSSISDYKRTITYIIKPYTSYKIFDSTDSINNAYKKEDNIKKVKDMIDFSALKKNYNYLFTGKNTEILNLDLNLNFNWSYLIDVSGGSVNSYSQTIGKMCKIETEQDDDIISLSDAFEEVTTGTSTSLGNNGYTSNIVSNSLNKVTSKINFDNALENVALDQLSSNSLSNSITNTNTSTSPHLPLRIQNQFRKDYDCYQYGAVNDGTGAKSLYSFLINQLQVENGYQDGLQNINMVIKGDPFWLGTPDDVSDYVKIVKGKQVSNTTASTTNTDTISYKINSNVANYTIGEQCFVLSFVLPNGYNDTNNTVNLNKSNLYSGIYSVQTVVSEFSSGAFTQTLNAFKINGMVPNEIINVKE